MERGPGESFEGLASKAESDLIEQFSGRIAGLHTFPGMNFVGLAWATSEDQDAPPIVRHIDALYRRVSARAGYADVAVRTWYRAPLAREEFSDDPYLGTHLRDFMLERSARGLDLDARIVAAFERAGRRAGQLSTGEFVAARYSFSEVVTLVGYADHVATSPRLTLDLGVIPRLRG